MPTARLHPQPHDHSTSGLPAVIGRVIALDYSKESSYTADHRPLVVGRGQASGFGGGVRELPSGREPPPADLLELVNDHPGRTWSGQLWLNLDR
jgi:hypothetical protein